MIIRVDQQEGLKAQVLYAYEGEILSNGYPQVLDQFLKATEGGKSGKVNKYAHLEGDDFIQYILLGLGKKEDLTHTSILKATGSGIKALKAMKAKEAGVDLSSFDQDQVKILVEGLIISDYDFNKYKEKGEPSPIESLYVTTDHLTAVEEGQVLGQSVLVARDLVNEPANVMTPAALAQAAVDYGKDFGFQVEVLDREAIEALGMEAYMNVAKASENPPKFIIMKWLNDPESDERLGLVGKGLTFDTGGYSLKPKEGMLTMKSDMGGSAAVIGAMCALAQMKVKKNVYGVIAACENMVSGGGYRPGDIIGSRGGKSIFINSTDAEGRLTLIDAVDYAIKDLKVTKVVDIATLTGACLVALGTTTTGVVSNNDAFYKALEEASFISGERVWRMPIFPEYKELVKHEDADLINSTRMAGMITAGIFIGEFVGDTPWLHMDIAGTSWTGSKNSYQSYGGTGAGVKNLYYLAKNN